VRPRDFDTETQRRGGPGHGRGSGGFRRQLGCRATPANASGTCLADAGRVKPDLGQVILNTRECGR
jgi:hypothetical protein